MRQVDVGELKRLLKTLPQELYDEIYVFTFTADDQVRIISEGWTPSHLLQIDRATRTHFAASYFHSSARFQFRLTGSIQDGARVMVNWLLAFEYSSIMQIQDIKYIWPSTDRARSSLALGRQGLQALLLVSTRSYAGFRRLSGTELQAVHVVGERVKILHGVEAEELRPFGCWA